MAGVSTGTPVFPAIRYFSGCCSKTEILEQLYCIQPLGAGAQGIGAVSFFAAGKKDLSG
jgi:hypothetical protein